MEATNFEESNRTLGPPIGCTEDQVGTIFAFSPPSLQTVTTCWKPTQAEIEIIKKTGRVWLTCLGTTMPPVILQADSPFPQ